MESLKLDKEKRIYDQNTIGESRWTLLCRRYKIDFALFIFLWIFFMSNCLLFFFHKCWVKRDQSPLFFHRLMFYCRQALSFCRSLKKKVNACMSDSWRLFLNLKMDWAHKIDRLMWKPYGDQCFQIQVLLLHANNPFNTTLSSSHLSYQLLPNEISQEANFAMVDSFTFLLSKL